MSVSTSDYAILLSRINNEIELIEKQLQRSRAARGVKYINNNNNNNSESNNNNNSNNNENNNFTSSVSPEVDPQHRGEVLTHSSPSISQREIIQTNILISEKENKEEKEKENTISHSPPIINSLPQQKEGTLLHLIKNSFGTEKFVPHFIVIKPKEGLCWFQSKLHYINSPNNPIGQIPFYRETQNSRGSRFKKAAVCWPLILPEDCPKANDPDKIYFALEYVNNKNTFRKCILAAESENERDAWVLFLSQFVEIYLPPRAESEELQHLIKRASIPQHSSEVIDGEAPGGNIL